MNHLLAHSVSAQRSTTAIRCWRQLKPWEVNAQERSRFARSLLIQAALWAPSMTERDILLEAVAELADPSDTAPARWSGQAAPEYQLSPTQLVVPRSETGPPP